MARTFANQTGGAGKLVAAGLTSLLALFPIVLFVPLVRMKWWVFRYNEITLARLAHDLLRTDLLLFLIVVLFGIVVPLCKLIMMWLCWCWLDMERAYSINRHIRILNKLSMLDVMLMAISVVALKGMGVGRIEIAYGLYLYVLFALANFGLSVAIDASIASGWPACARCRTSCASPGSCAGRL